jgi:hypothetical protein
MDPNRTPERAAESATVSHTPARSRSRHAGEADLCTCEGCGCPFVQPVDWAMIGTTHWRVSLRCPNCETVETGVYGQDAVDRFDRELDRGTRKLQTTLARVSRACMEADIEQFSRALQSDLILPIDF